MSLLGSSGGSRDVARMMTWDIDLFAEKYDPAISAALEHAHQTACKTVESAIAAIFPMYAALLEGTAKPVVTGESWDSGFYSDWTL